jgi:hypothetical protein
MASRSDGGRVRGGVCGGLVLDFFGARRGRVWVVRVCLHRPFHPSRVGQVQGSFGYWLPSLMTLAFLLVAFPLWCECFLHSLPERGLVLSFLGVFLYTFSLLLSSVCSLFLLPVSIPLLV